MRPDLIMKSIIPVVMAGIIAIYGLVVAVLITGNLEDKDYTMFQSFVHLGAGLSVGLSGLAAGFAIGIVGDAGVRGTAQQPKLYVGMILILIFAEVLGLYGLIVAIYLYAKKKEGSYLQIILPGHQQHPQPTKYRIELKCCDDHIEADSKLKQVPIKSDPCILRGGFNIFTFWEIK